MTQGERDYQARTIGWSLEQEGSVRGVVLILFLLAFSQSVDQ